MREVSLTLRSWRIDVLSVSSLKAMRIADTRSGQVRSYCLAMLVTCTAWGSFKGLETIAGVYAGLSPSAAVKLEEARHHGLIFDGMEVVIVVQLDVN
jgi:hypothetical protein